MKPESQSTAMRVVFNSSAKINGTSLNKCLAKGPSLLNNMLGILLRFRQNEFAFIGDISKMYHSIDIPYEDQLTHLFLWRDLDQNVPPKTYAIAVVNMGDRPSAAIVQTALRKSAEAAESIYPEASKVIINNSYMDDIPGSTTDESKGKQVMNDAECLLDKRGFKIKGWTFSGQEWKKQKTTDQHAVQVLLNKNEDDDSDKVLGMGWNTETDKIIFSLKRMDFTKRETTKRACLSTIYRIYDPLGLLAPVTVAAKIILRKVWAARPHIDWDDTLPNEVQQDWDSFRESLEHVPQLQFQRAVKPTGDTSPILIILSDGSKQAYGAAAYVRWTTDNGYISKLLTAKSRIAPLKVIDTVRLELCGAVINSRLYSFIRKEMPELPFQTLLSVLSHPLTALNPLDQCLAD